MARMDWRRAKRFVPEYEPRPSGISAETEEWAKRHRAKHARRGKGRRREVAQHWDVQPGLQLGDDIVMDQLVRCCQSCGEEYERPVPEHNLCPRCAALGRSMRWSRRRTVGEEWTPWTPY